MSSLDVNCEVTFEVINQHLRVVKVTKCHSAYSSTTTLKGRSDGRGKMVNTRTN